MKKEIVYLVVLACLTFLNSFLMFFVQPMVAKAILPSFGGTATVWTGVMLFFQVGLVAGYGVAHWLRIARGWKLVGLYAGLVLLGVAGSKMDLLLSVSPGQFPMLSLISALMISVGFPFLLLSATTPVLQMLCFRLVGEEPYWLYGVSNMASFLALLAYPVVFEPQFLLPQQIVFWKVALLILGLALLFMIMKKSVRRSNQAVSVGEQESHENSPSSIKWPLTWFIYPFLASVSFISFTQHLTIDVAPVPLLWVLPLSIYLLSFVIVFARKPFYSERWVPVMCLFACCIQAFPYFSWGQGKAIYVLSGSLINLFVMCWFCHGRLILERPAPQHLTRFYLALSIGGALGGVFCGIVAPLIFSGNYEYPLVVLVISLIAFKSVALVKDAPFSMGNASFLRRLSIAAPLTCVGFILAFHFLWFLNLDEKVLTQERNFYSSVRIRENEKTIDMISGRIVHGIQAKIPDGAYVPTAYFHEKSAVGVIFDKLNQGGEWNAGVIGLGVGTVAGYTREGDRMAFIEIDPKVVRMATDYFDFIEQAKGDVVVHTGDGRKQLNVFPEASFDMFMIDAFTGDSVPAHLLTREAFREYKRYLKPAGLLVFHISNEHLQLDRLMAGLAIDQGWSLLIVDSPGLKPYGNPNQYAVFSKEVVNLPEFDGEGRVVRRGADVGNHILWTDYYSNILRIFKR